MTDLNEKSIKTALPGQTLRDATVRGLHMRVTAKAKTFYLYYRTKAGLERRPKLGEHGTVTLTQARDMAREMLGDVAKGLDPAAAVRESKKEPTLTDLWNEWRKRRGLKKKASSAVEDERLWRLHLEPRFGRKRLSEITYSKLSDMVERMADRPMAANRSCALLSTMFNFAIAPLKWTAENPTKGVTRYPETKRKRYMAGEEAARISELLLAEEERYPASVAFIYLLILTGARKGEIAAAKWDWIKGNTIQLPDSKTGEKPVYLPPQAMDVINRLPRTTGTITGIKNVKHFWTRVRTKAGCPDLRLHDLRHSFASAAVSAGLSLAQIGELLGHKSPETTKRYAHLVEEAATAAVTATADRIMVKIPTKP